MNKFLKVAGIATLVALVGVVAVAGWAMAQEPTPPPDGWHGLGRGFGPMGRGGWSTFDAAAEALGLSPEQLFSELHAGKTLTELAEEKGVDLQAITDAVAAARQEAMRQAIEQAVEDGQMSREQADWLLKGMEQGWMPGGRGFRGHGCGPGKFLNPESQDSIFPGRFAVPGRSI